MNRFWNTTLKMGVRYGMFAVFAVALVVLTTGAGSPPPPATGLTAFAQDGAVVLAWQPSSGAASYDVLRGVSPTTLAPLTTGLTGTTYVDAAAVDGQAFYYAVVANNTSGSAAPSAVAGASPQARSCSTGNAVVVENCFPGTTAWKTVSALDGSHGGIEGFGTLPSIQAGQSVDIKVRASADNVPFHIEVYRSGWYAGTQGRLVSTLPGLVANTQPACPSDSTTGLKACSNWSTVATLTTTADWPSGVYLLRLVRDDNGADNHVLLVVRNDASRSALLYGVPVSAYQAYNNYGGKSLYEFNSSGAATVTGTARAVKVSFERPYQQSATPQADWYTTSDVRNVAWLEQQGYDVTYTTNIDLHENGGQVQQHRVFLSGAHDEYWSGPQRTAVTAARDAGTSLVFLGANAVYWKVRYEPGPISGTPDMVLVCYKTIQGGPADPSGDPTTTWRDPAGPNQPENALIGQMYVGDNDGAAFRLQVSAAMGTDPVWRRTALARLAPGTSTTVGTSTVGWEWDGRSALGEPAGVTTLAATPVSGNLIQNNGANTTPGSTTSNATKYQADSGALVFATGTNNWSRGLGVNMAGSGEPNTDMQQATMNVLTDMGAGPTTPTAGLTADDVTQLAVTSRSPAANATAVNIGSSVTATFGFPVVPSTLSTSTFTLAGPGGPVAASVSYDRSKEVATLTPSAPLAASTTYTATLAASIATAWGTSLGTPVTWTFTTDAAAVLNVTAKTPVDGTTGLPTTAIATATFSLALDPTTVTTSSFTLNSAGGPVAANVGYNPASKTATLTPSAPLARGVQYTATACQATWPRLLSRRG